MLGWFFFKGGGSVWEDCNVFTDVIVWSPCLRVIKECCKML